MNKFFKGGKGNKHYIYYENFYNIFSRVHARIMAQVNGNITNNNYLDENKMIKPFSKQLPKIERIVVPNGSLDFAMLQLALRRVTACSNFYYDENYTVFEVLEDMLSFEAEVA